MTSCFAISTRSPAPADDDTGLKQVSYAMTEQVRALSNERAGRHLGQISDSDMATISRYLHLFIV